MTGSSEKIRRMLKKYFKDHYPVYQLKIEKKQLKSSDIDIIIQQLTQKIKSHPVARFIADFDHHQHTRELAAGEISKDILNARVLSFCFGKILDDPLILAVRPRNIGVAELVNHFVFSFMEAPKPELNQIMENWIHSLLNSDKTL